MSPIEITDSNFEQEVKNSDVPVLLDFWAVWCGPCKSIGRSVDELAGEYGDKIKCHREGEKRTGRGGGGRIGHGRGVTAFFLRKKSFPISPLPAIKLG